MNELPYVEDLSLLLDYNKETGVFTWTENAHAQAKGKVAGNRDPRGYLRINVRCKLYYGHRLAWMMVNGPIPTGTQVDHINGIKSDNRIANLRLALPHQNSNNSKNFSSNTSGVKGVSWSERDRVWRACVRFQNKNYNLPPFRDLDAATEAIKALREKLHGEFSRHETGDRPPSPRLPSRLERIHSLGREPRQ